MSLEELRARWQRALSYRGRCVGCEGTRVWHIGIRLRAASVMLEEQTAFIPDIPERRLKCRECGAQWTHAPEGISSRAHYQACVVAHALEMMEHEPETSAAEIAHTHGCHRRTLARWIDRVADLADPRELGAAVVAEAEAPVLPELATEVRRPGGAHVHKRLVHALAVLALLEALASLRGLEPPALGHGAALVRTMPAIAPGPKSRGDPRSHV